MHYPILILVLYLFWLLLSGHLTLFFLSLGLISVLLIAWLQHRMDQIDREPALLKITLKLFRYAGWLSWNVLLSNIDVVRRIWDPKLPIDPVWERLDTHVESAREKTLYANSITLTPGTLTTDIKDDHFLIHTLTPDGMKQLREGEMEKQIKRLRI